MAIPNYAYRLQKNREKVLKDLEPRKILNILYQEEVFDLDEMDEVKEEKTRKKQAEMLLDKITRAGDRNMAIFVNGLQKTQRHLYELLQRPVDGEVLAQGDTRIEDITRQITTVNIYQEPPTYINKALSPTTHPPQLGNTDKGAAYCQTSEDHILPPNDEMPSFVIPTDWRKLPPHIHPESELVYPMTSKPKGITLIINNEVFHPNPELTQKEKEKEELDIRHGSDKDVQSLEKLFEALDFKVKVERNIGRKRILDILDDISREDHREYDCFVLCLMSHGQDGLFYGADGETVPVESVRDFFNNAKCPSLKGKPKLFFIQACRGRGREKGVVADAPSAQSPQAAPNFLSRQPSTNDDLTANSSENIDRGFNFHLSKTIPEHSDILIANSTMSGYAAFRNPKDGSRFVRCVVEVFQEFAGHEDLLSMLTMVNKRISEMGEIDSKQVSEPTSTLTKKLFFWPGLK